jgi:hypothetical protein
MKIKPRTVRAEEGTAVSSVKMSTHFKNPGYCLRPELFEMALY